MVSERTKDKRYFALGTILAVAGIPSMTYGLRDFKQSSKPNPIIQEEERLTRLVDNYIVKLSDDNITNPFSIRIASNNFADVKVERAKLRSGKEFLEAKETLETKLNNRTWTLAGLIVTAVGAVMVGASYINLRDSDTKTYSF